MRARLGLVLVGVTGLAAGCAPPGGTSPTGSAKEPPTVTVTTAPVTARAVRRSVDAVGTLRGYDEVTLSPKVSGRVQAVPVDIGDVVHPGQVLLTIDPADASKEVDRARRALELELAKLALPALRSKEDFEAEDVPTVRRAQAALVSAQREFDRLKGLSGASDREIRTTETELQLARATKNVALAEAAAGLSAAWLRKDELDAAELRLADCTLRAPVPTGWYAWAAMVTPGFTPLRYSVALKLLAEGDLAQANPPTPAFKLVIDRALRLPLPVPERFAAEIGVGLPVEVRVDAFPGTVFAGSIYRVSPVADPQNRVFYAVAAVPNLDGRLLAGSFARATILTRTESVTTVPPEAIVSFAGVTKVFVIEEGRARAIEVKLGSRDKDWIELLGEIPAGATVATSGFSLLVDGSPVKVRQ
jgi:multidrug efflux pump subunit AcrA (membrane-fusion protein)